MALQNTRLEWIMLSTMLRENANDDGKVWKSVTFGNEIY